MRPVQHTRPNAQTKCLLEKIVSDLEEQKKAAVNPPEYLELLETPYGRAVTLGKEHPDKYPHWK